MWCCHPFYSFEVKVERVAVLSFLLDWWGGPLTAALFSRLGPHSFALRVGGIFISTNGGSSGSERISGRAEAKTGRNEVRIGGTCLLTLIMLRHMVAETMQPTSLQPDRSYPASLR